MTQQYTPDAQTFEQLQAELDRGGPEAAIGRLCDLLRERGDYHNLFNALLLKARHGLGVSPIPTLSSADVPGDLTPPYLEAARGAAREVGRLFLERGDIAAAWPYFRMLDEPGPVKEALEAYTPGEGDDLDSLVGIAYSQGVHPKKGFDIILERYGLCNAITTLGSREFPGGDDAHAYCIRRLVQTLYAELRERLAAEIEHHEGKPPPPGTPVRELIGGRFYLFGGDAYHVDVSHLISVIRMSVDLPPCDELAMARELCAYGEKLSPTLKYNSEPPFEEMYKDFGVYLSILAGDRPEEGLAYFRQKIEGYDPAEVGTFPAEVFVNLLLRAGRGDEAVDVAGKYLVDADERSLTCPGIVELCEKTKKYHKLSELARAHNNLVHFVAGLVADRGGAGGAG